jgi:hypothetical protein
VTVYHADIGEGLHGLTRARKAYEHAVRDNFKELMAQLAKFIATQLQNCKGGGEAGRGVGRGRWCERRKQNASELPRR